MSKLNKRQKQLLLILAITAVTFSIIVFLIPFRKSGTFWIAYIAEIIALGLQIPIFKLAFDNAEELKSKVLGFPVFRVGYLYLCIQSVVSVILFALGCIPGFPLWVSALFCILILAAAIICSITADIAREEVEKIEISTKKDTAFMNSLRTRSANLVDRTDNASLKKELEKLSEKIRFSDPVSSPEISDFEKELSEKLSQLENAVKENNPKIAEELCKEVNFALDDRNTACRNNKQ